MASASGPMLEEMLFRGLLFWLVFELLTHCHVSKLAAVSATILVIAVGFAFSHSGRTGLSLYTTILTGIAVGWIRAGSKKQFYTPSTTWCSIVYCDVLAPPLPLLHCGLPPLFGRAFLHQQATDLYEIAQRCLVPFSAAPYGPDEDWRGLLRSLAAVFCPNRPSRFSAGALSFAIRYFLPKPARPPWVLRTDICGRSVSGQPAFFDTRYRRRSSRYRERRTPPNCLAIDEHQPMKVRFSTASGD